MKTPRAVAVFTERSKRQDVVPLFVFKVVRHAKAMTFQLAEVVVPRALFAALLARIGRLRAAPSPG